MTAKKIFLSSRMSLCSALLLSLVACGGGGGGGIANDNPSAPDNGKPGMTDEVENPTQPSIPAPGPTPNNPAPAPNPAAPTAGSVSLELLRDDMMKEHESTVHGVNPAWSWGSAPRMGVDVNFPSSYDDPHFVPWGIAATSTQYSSARNARVQIRRMILDVKRNGQWSRIVYNTADSQLMGSLYTNYETNATAPANTRNHGTDGISVKLPDSGGSFHFMTTNRFRVPFGAQEIVSRFEARLIVDDPSKPDDRASARLLAGSGGDIWRNASAQWNPNTLSNVDFAIGRFKYVTNEWTTFTSHTLRTEAEINDYLSRESSLGQQ